MDEYKQYYYSARPSAQGKAFGRFVHHAVTLFSRHAVQTAATSLVMCPTGQRFASQCFIVYVRCFIYILDVFIETINEVKEVF